jgi:hypothetical protein
MGLIHWFQTASMIEIFFLVTTGVAFIITLIVFYYVSKK